MSGFTSFAVAGAGGLGQFVVEEFAKKGIAVKVLTRPDSSKAFPSPAQAVSVDYSSPESLESALKGVDVVISTLGFGGFAVQPALADAAKKAGVKHFVPSEFGNPTVGLTEGLLVGKTKLHEHLDKLGLPYTLTFTGPFSDTIFQPFAGYDFANKKVSLPAPGDKPISFTARKDAARFLVHILTTSTSPPKILRLEGDKQSFKDTVAIYESTHPGVKLEQHWTPLEELQEKVKANPGDFISYLLLQWTTGKGVVGEPDNKLWPDWAPAKVEDFLKATP